MLKKFFNIFFSLPTYQAILYNADAAQKIAKCFFLDPQDMFLYSVHTTMKSCHFWCTKNHKPTRRQQQQHLFSLCIACKMAFQIWFGSISPSWCSKIQHPAPHTPCQLHTQHEIVTSARHHHDTSSPFQFWCWPLVNQYLCGCGHDPQSRYGWNRLWPVGVGASYRTWQLWLLLSATTVSLVALDCLGCCLDFMFAWHCWELLGRRLWDAWQCTLGWCLLRFHGCVGIEVVPSRHHNHRWENWCWSWCK